MTDTLTTRQVADKIGTDPKTLRKFFRSDACDVEPVGQGARYGFTKEDIPALKKAFGAWGKGTAKKESDAEPLPDKAPAKDAKAKKGKKAKAPEPVDLPDEDEELDSLDGPSDADIEDLEMDLTEEDLEV